VLLGLEFAVAWLVVGGVIVVPVLLGGLALQIGPVLAGFLIRTKVL